MGTTGLETAFAALYTELVLPGDPAAGAARRADDRRRRAVRPAGPARSRPARPPTSRSSTSTPSGSVGEHGYESRSENCCFAGRTLRGRVLLTVAAGAVAYRERVARRRWRSAVSPTHAPTSCSRTARASTATPCGADAHATGEVVFTTGMSGYQESMTDPSFAGQLITFTYPHIGNYGVSAEAMESDRIHGRAPRSCARRSNREDAPGAERGWLDWLADCGIPAITGVDTRALVRHIRDAGAMRGGVFPARDGRGARRASSIAAEPPMTGLDLAREVTPARDDQHGDGDGPRIAAIDTGIKALDRAQPRRARRAASSCTRAPRRAEELLAGDARRRSSSPTAPATRPRSTTSSTRSASSSASSRCAASASATSCCAARSAWRPSSCRSATAAPTTRSRTSRPGAIEITSQNHGFAVLGPGGARTIDADEPVRWETDFGAAAAQPRQPLRPHRRGPQAARRARRDGPVPPRGRARPARHPLPLRPLPRPDQRRPRSHAAPRRHPQDPDPRLRPDRHRPGRRVRLLRRAGLQGAARGGLRGRARQLQPGDDHDRPGVRRRDVRRAAAARARSRRSSSASAPTRCCRRSAARPR